MDGRWTIKVAENFGRYVEGPLTMDWVPVVPCDDAAIARSGDALLTLDLSRYDCIEIAEMVLRAAGETS